jgi:hypothetical protein
VLMGSHDGAVDHRVFVVGIGHEVLKNPLPYPVPGPLAEPPVGVLPVAEPLRQIAPRDAGTVSIENGFDESTIVARGGTDISGFPRKQVLYSLPLIVAQSISGHGSALCQSRLSMNHTNSCRGRLFLLFTFLNGLALRAALQ